MLLVLCVGLSVFMEGSFTDTFAAETCEFKCGTTSSPRKKKEQNKAKLFAVYNRYNSTGVLSVLHHFREIQRDKHLAAPRFGAFQHVIVQPPQFSLSENKGKNIWTYTECAVFTYTYIVCTHTRIHTWSPVGMEQLQTCILLPTGKTKQKRSSDTNSVSEIHQYVYVCLHQTLENSKAVQCHTALYNPKKQSNLGWSYWLQVPWRKTPCECFGCPKHK